MLPPIEAHLCTDDDPHDWELVVRGRPLTVDGLLASAARTLAEFSWNGSPLAAISAEVTGSDRSLAEVLAGPRLRTRRTYAAATAAELIDGGFPVLATFAAPHVSVVLPAYDDATVRDLLAILGPEQANPYFLRTAR